MTKITQPHWDIENPTSTAKGARVKEMKTQMIIRIIALLHGMNNFTIYRKEEEALLDAHMHEFIDNNKLE
jgi:hypothetical protein